jgi:hypothetical protein
MPAGKGVKIRNHWKFPEGSRRVPREIPGFPSEIESFQNSLGITPDTTSAAVSV